MNDVYVHTLRYHYSGRTSRQSRTMFPISYGPFKDEDAAWEWTRQGGIMRATKLMYGPAKENIKVSYNHPVEEQHVSRAGLLRSRLRRNIGT